MKPDQSAAPVMVELVDRTLVVTLNRPEVRNAIDRDMAEGLAAALDRADRDDGVAVVVLAAAGPDFCSGMDLKAFTGGDIPDVPGRGFAGIVEYSSRRPVIAAVEGRALAGGFEVVLACDMVVASEAAIFALPEVRRGLVPAAGGLVRLPRRVPRAAALEMTLTGEPVSADRLHQLGLVNRLVAPGRALAEALELTAGIATNAPLAIATAKEVIDLQTEWGVDEIWRRQRPYTERVQQSADAREGARAFLEKRAPQWSGS